MHHWEKDPELLRLPFDLHQRYRVVAEVASGLRDGGRLRLVDVGGGPSPLGMFLPDDLVIGVDVARAYPGQPEPPLFVYGSGTQLPFSDGSIDVVCSMDTLEHVPVAERAQLVEQVARVASRAVILSFPRADPEVKVAELLLLEFCRSRVGPDAPISRILSEHRQYPNVVLESVCGLLSGAGMECLLLPQGNLAAWLAMMLAAQDMTTYGLGDEILALQETYNRLLAELDTRPPAYRTIVIAWHRDDETTQTTLASMARQASDGAPSTLAHAAGAALHVAAVGRALSSQLTEVQRSGAWKAHVDEVGADVQSLRNDVLTGLRDLHARLGELIEHVLDSDRRVAELDGKIASLEALAARLRRSLPARLIRRLLH